MVRRVVAGDLRFSCAELIRALWHSKVEELFFVGFWGIEQSNLSERIEIQTYVYRSLFIECTLAGSHRLWIERSILQIELMRISSKQKVSGSSL